MINKLLRLLFSEKCPICARIAQNHYTAPVCSGCWEGISLYRGALCEVCGRPLASEESITCGDCISDAPLFKNARSFGLYDGVIKEAISLFKYHCTKRLSKPLSDIMLKIKMPEVDLVLPVPLHKKRLRHRGFNQSALLARHVAKRISIPLITDCLVRVKDTVPQVGLHAKERKKNIKNAFEVRNKCIEAKRLMLIDDVFTTGATVRECSKVLKKAGAKDIYVVTLAHGKGDF